MKRHVVVLGAGYAGLPAAKRIARQLRPEEVEVTLVNAGAEFAERPRLHQIATGQDVGILPLRPLLTGSGVRFVQDRVTGIDLDGRTVILRDGPPLAYDLLVYGLGSTIDLESVPGVRANTYALTDIEAAAELRAALPDLSTLAVCGGGLTGMEVATEIAERYPGIAVKLVTDQPPGAWLSAKALRYLDRVLAELRIEVVTGARVASAEPDRFRLTDGRKVWYDAAVWAGGFRVPDLARDAGLEVDPTGRVRVGSDLRSLSHPDVYVVGDAAAVPGPWGEQLAMGCRTGGLTAPKAADAVVARLTGGATGPFRFRYIHECLSLGRRHGLVQFLAADGTPTERVLTGRAAIAYKNSTLSGARVLMRHPGPVVPRRRPLVPTRPPLHAVRAA